jgi:UTP:GlnB (protein PII) uridylyltransferase
MVGGCGPYAPRSMQTRAEYSQERLDELARRMDPVLGLLDEHPLCVYATGSYGRLEGWSGSDIDLFFLYDNQDETERLPRTTFVQLASHLIRTTDDMGFPPFSGDGRYLDVQYIV